MTLFDKAKLKKIKEKKKVSKKHTLMVVDDEEAQLFSLESLLSEEYAVITAKDGQEALDMITGMENPESISLIICDQRMPKLTGIQVFERLIDILPNTIRIILTAFTDISVIIDSINKARIYKFILKPFDPEDFKITVKRALESFDLQQQLEQYQRNLELEVKKRTRELEKTNRELDETNKELRELSLTDPLTGLRNIRYLNEFIDQDIAMVQKEYEELSVKYPMSAFPGRDFIFFILEIDEFKMMNDTFRRSVLDRLLVQFSVILKDFFVDSDIIVRRGDAEFLIVNRFTEREKSQQKAKFLLRAVEDHIFDLETDKKIDLTCSLGSACYPFISSHYDAVDWKDVINIAEFALGTAKNSGGSTWVGIFSTDKTRRDNLYQRIIEEIEKLLANGELNVQSSLKVEKLVWRKDKITHPKIRRRLDILKKLNILIFNPDTREAKIHNIFENNLWILGTEYSKMSSNETLKKVVEEYLDKKYSGNIAKSRPDLLLARGMEKRYLLIEFKRPGHTLDRSDEYQAVVYRDDLNAHIPDAKIEITLIGGRIKANISAHYSEKGVEYLTYKSVISNARNNIKWLLEDLERDRK